MNLEQIPMAGVAREQEALRPELERAMLEVLASGAFILGPFVERLERALEETLGLANVVSCGNGTDALVLALRALGVGPGDEVIVPAFTFFASAEAVSLVGATPVFADVEAATALLDPEDAARRVTPRTRAVIAVHLFGQCVDIAALRALPALRDIAIVEDAAQAIGASLRGTPAGALGDVAAFSFYPTKNLGAAGDGGMVTTADPELAARLRTLRAHGSSGGYRHERVGMNSRLDGLQAAILSVKLPHLASWNARRRENAQRLREALADGGPRPLEVVSEGVHAVHHFTVTTEDRAGLQARLAEHGVGSAIYYPIPLHQQPAFASQVADVTLPVAERLAAQVLSVPVHPWLSEAEVGRVASALVG